MRGAATIFAIAIQFPPQEANGVNEFLYQVFCPEEAIVQRTSPHECRINAGLKADSSFRQVVASLTMTVSTENLTPQKRVQNKELVLTLIICRI